MHINRTVIGFDYGFLSLWERRLCFLDQQRRHDLLDEAVQTQGKMESRNPLQALQSNTEELAADIAKIRVGWGEWINNFFRSSSVIDKKMQTKIMQASETHIQEKSDLAVGKIKGLFLRGKRRLYLASREKIAEHIRSDLYNYLQSKQKESVEREGRFNRLSQMLQETKKPLPLKSPAERQKLLDSLKRVGDQLQGKRRERDRNGEEMPKEWESARETEQMLKQQLLELNILDPTKIDAYLALNAQGGTQLQILVGNNSELKKKKELRTCLINALKELRRGNARYYRLQEFMEQNANTGTIEQRLKYIQQDANILGRKMRLAFGGTAPFDAFVVHRGDGFLTLKKADTQNYYILDLQTGEVTYRDKSRVFHDYPLKESSFSLT